MGRWIVSVQWAGDQRDIQRLFTVLAHLEPVPDGDRPIIRVVVTARSGPAAELYVSRLLVRDGLETRASVVGSDADAVDAGSRDNGCDDHE